MFSEFADVRVESRSDTTSDGSEWGWEAGWRNRLTVWKATVWECYEKPMLWALHMIQSTSAGERGEINIQTCS